MIDQCIFIGKDDASAMITVTVAVVVTIFGVAILIAVIVLIICICHRHHHKRHQASKGTLISIFHNSHIKFLSSIKYVDQIDGKLKLAQLNNADDTTEVKSECLPVESSDTDIDCDDTTIDYAIIVSVSNEANIH